MRAITKPQRETLHRLYLLYLFKFPYITYREFRRTALVLNPSPVDQIMYKPLTGGQVLVDIGTTTYGIELDGYAHT